MNYEDRVTKEHVENAIAAKCEVVFGSYTGDGNAIKNIDLGFQPKAVLVIENGGKVGYYSGSQYTYGGLALPGKPVAIDGYNALVISSTGFIVYKHSGYDYIRINLSETTYDYLAFK